MRGLRVPIVIGLLFAVLWIAGSGSGAGASQGNYPPPTLTVEPSRIPTSDPTPPPSGEPTTTPSVEPSRGPEPSDPPENLPFTGADLTRFVLIGAGLTVAGTGFVKLARKTRGSDA